MIPSVAAWALDWVFAEGGVVWWVRVPRAPVSCSGKPRQHSSPLPLTCRPHPPTCRPPDRPSSAPLRVLMPALAQWTDRAAAPPFDLSTPNKVDGVSLWSGGGWPRAPGQPSQPASGCDATTTAPNKQENHSHSHSHADAEIRSDATTTSTTALPTH